MREFHSKNDSMQFKFLFTEINQVKVCTLDVALVTPWGRAATVTTQPHYSDRRLP